MDEGEYPSLEELMDVIKNTKDLSDNDRQELIRSLFKEGTPGMTVPLPEPPFTHQAMVLAAMLFLVALTFGVKMSEADVLKDILKGFKGLGKDAGLGEEETEAASGILDQLITGYQDMSEEDKAKFRQSAQDQVISHLQESLTSRISQVYYAKFGVVAACVVVVLFLFVFFGYKLIKSIKDKEKKKEEKKKQKQSKKKK